MKDHELAPILVIGYNRPDFLSDRLNQLLMSERRIYIAIDGPRNAKHEIEVAKSRDVAKAFHEKQSLFQEVHLLIRESNLGCKYGVATAIDWIFESESKAIIIEDDIVFSSDFLTTMDSWLEHHNENKEIFHLNGFNPLSRKQELNSSYLSRYPHVWGWATWKDRWQFYDRELSTWKASDFPFLPGLIGQNLSDDFFKYWSLQIEMCRNGFDTWDIQWTYSQWRYGGFSVTPGARLTGNIGFDDRATHTRRSGNRNRELLPRVVNLNFANDLNPIFNLETNKIHDRVEHGIHGTSPGKNSLLISSIKPFLKTYLRLMVLTDFGKKLASIWQPLSKYLQLMLKLLRLVKTLVCFIAKAFKYMYWRKIRPLILGLFSFIAKAFKYMYWRKIRPLILGLFSFISKR